MHFISIGSENEDSDQEREWEEQQIKKGVSLGSEVRVKWNTTRLSCTCVNVSTTQIYPQCMDLWNLFIYCLRKQTYDKKERKNGVKFHHPILSLDFSYRVRMFFCISFELIMNAVEYTRTLYLTISVFDWQQPDGGSSAAAPTSSDQYNGFQDTTVLEKKTFTAFPSLTQTGGSTVINMELIRKRLQDRYVPSGLWAVQVCTVWLMIGTN